MSSCDLELDLQKHNLEPGITLSPSYFTAGPTQFVTLSALLDPCPLEPIIHLQTIVSAILFFNWISLRHNGFVGRLKTICRDGLASRPYQTISTNHVFVAAAIIPICLGGSV